MRKKTVSFILTALISVILLTSCVVYVSADCVDNRCSGLTEDFVGSSSILVHNLCTQKLVAGDKGNWNARVSIGGEQNHAMGHAHVFWKNENLASVDRLGNIIAGDLPSKGIRFVQSNLDKIAAGIDKWYFYIG